MDKILYNEDYVKGIKFLLEKSKEQGINVRRCTWIPHISKMLSEHDLCYKFWYNVVKQGYLNRIFLCETWNDIMYVSERWLFLWALTREGNTFWKTNLWEMLGLNEKENFLDFHEKLQDMWL